MLDIAPTIEPFGSICNQPISSLSRFKYSCHGSRSVVAVRPRAVIRLTATAARADVQDWIQLQIKRGVDDEAWIAWVRLALLTQQPTPTAAWGSFR